MDFLDSILDFFDIGDFADVNDLDLGDSIILDDNLTDSISFDDDWVPFEQTDGCGSSISFHGENPPNENSDGFIPKGTVSLERTTSDKSDVFKLYKKDGNSFIFADNQYKQINGSGTIKIGNVKYDKI